MVGRWTEVGGPGSGRRPEGQSKADRARRLPERVAAQFQPCRFVGYLLDGTMRFDKNGGLMVTFVMPVPEVERALGLRQFLEVSPPLTIDVRPYDGWSARAEENGLRREEREGRREVLG